MKACVAEPLLLRNWLLYSTFLQLCFIPCKLPGSIEIMNLHYINLSDYPLLEPKSSAYQNLVETWQKDLSETGLINLEGFLTPAGIAEFRGEIYDRMPEAFHSVHGAQAYFDNMLGEIPGEVLGSNTYCLGHHNLIKTNIDALYQWEPLRAFIAALTVNSEVFLHEDPTNALVVQLYKPGCWTGWHFDRAVFTTIVNLGEPEEGGVFECAPEVRTEDDPNYDEVREVLMNRSAKTRRYEMKAGSLTLMLGRYSIHRVTEVKQQTDRISLVLKYETEPGVFISAADRRLIYGPNAPGPDRPGKIATN